MLGITGSEAAVFIGTAVGALILALLGKKAGDKAKAVVPIDPVTSGIAAGFVDKDKMDRLVMAVESIAGTLKRHLDIQTDEHENQVTETLMRIQEGQDRLAAAVRKRDEDDARADRTVTRVESTLKKPRRD